MFTNWLYRGLPTAALLAAAAILQVLAFSVFV